MPLPAAIEKWLRLRANQLTCQVQVCDHVCCKVGLLHCSLPRMLLSHCVCEVFQMHVIKTGHNFYCLEYPSRLIQAEVKRRKTVWVGHSLYIYFMLNQL